MTAVNKFHKLTIQTILLMTTAIAAIGCGIYQSANSSQSITREECETDKSFAFIPAGEYILGSDRTERDYGYNISAQAIANSDRGRRSSASPAFARRGTLDPSVAQAEQKLRETGWFDRESDRQTASLDGFCLSRNLVTNQEYQEFIEATNHRTPDISAADYQKQGFLVHPYSKVREFLWSNNTYPADTAEHPVVLISYEDALAYARWKGDTGQTYRLPTAFEWEKAARGEDGKYFPWGNKWLDDGTNAANSGLNYTNAIAQFRASQSVYGIEDMAGNVFEYTSTLKSQDTRAVMKGCSWDDLPGFCRASYSHTRPIDSRHILFGFRLVREK